MPKLRCHIVFVANTHFGGASAVQRQQIHLFASQIRHGHNNLLIDYAVGARVVAGQWQGRLGKRALLCVKNIFGNILYTNLW